MTKHLLFLIVVKPDYTARLMNDKLESLLGIKDVQVTRLGKCSGYEWTVEFLTYKGDAPALTVSIFTAHKINLE